MQIIGPELSWKEVFLTWDKPHPSGDSSEKTKSALWDQPCKPPLTLSDSLPSLCFLPSIVVQLCTLPGSRTSPLPWRNNTIHGCFLCCTCDYTMEKYWHSQQHICSWSVCLLLLQVFSCFIFRQYRRKRGKVARYMWAASGQARTWDIPWTQTGIWLFVDSCYKNPSPDRMKRSNPSLKKFTQNTPETHFKPQDNIHNINGED